MESGTNSVVSVSVVTPNDNTNPATTREQPDIPISPQYDDLISQVASAGFGEPPPAYTEHEAEFNQVITEEPPQYHDLFPPEVSVEESSENLAIVEQALTSAHFKEASGFSLNYGCKAILKKWYIFYIHILCQGTIFFCRYALLPQLDNLSNIESLTFVKR